MLTNEKNQILNDNLLFWDKLNDKEKEHISDTSVLKKYVKGEQLLSGGECKGLVIVVTGQLRAFITSEDGKEITIFRLLSRDVCILSASCMFKNLSFDINIDVEKNSELIIIPANVFKELRDNNIHVNEFSFDLVSSRFSEVMWLLEQLVFSSLGKRLAGFLIEQSNIDESDTLHFTHEYIAQNLGSAREVITRLLKYFENDEMVTLSRSTIKIIDYNKLLKLSM